MKIAIIGTGYVGLVTGTCLSDLGHKVTCIDLDKKKINNLKKGIVPIYEQGLEELVIKNIKKNNLSFTNSLKKGIKGAKTVFVCVQTPSKKDGSVELKYVYKVAKQLSENIESYKVIVNKSTVPVGTAKEVKKIIKKKYKGDFDVVSCPEFLREGSAVIDFFGADRIIVGCESEKSCQIMKEIFKKMKVKKIFTNLENAELVKYASNAFLATKISFINEMSNICERVGADVEVVARGMGLDRRIGQYFLRAGIGYGGSCFPKDVKGLNQISGTHGYDFKLLKAVIEVNNYQRQLLVERSEKILKNLKNKQITIFGLAFKNNTDDIRESAAIEIIKRLQKKGAKVQAYDPVAQKNAAKVLNNIIFWEDPYKACENSQALIIATEWPHYKDFDWKKIKHLLRRPIVLDGRNLLDPEKMKKLGFIYESIGR
ncbi:MAG: UDP-glucose/GDP-mannose dehydrogenase family protein [Patescibacteria group bacterium]|nr:UDP-glucose/GDP-mannose dehydrogenase family protein [Patescibacteria group bacterium]